jgi:regulator of RNase E activity RraA
MHQTLSLAGVLRAMNSEQQYRLNQSIYLLSNEVGAGDNFVGADASASWWHRNFRMYANIQLAASPGKRVLVIAGQGHIAVIKDFLANDTQRKAVFVDSFF